MKHILDEMLRERVGSNFDNEATFSADEVEQIIAALEKDTSPPSSQVLAAQALLHAIDRTAVAKIIDPTGWKNEGGYAIEQESAGPALTTADQVITYIVLTARRLATPAEGSGHG